MAKKLTKKQLNESKRELLTNMLAGKTALEIKDTIGLDGEVFDEVMMAVLQDMSDELSTRPVEHVFADHMIHGHAMIQKLESFTSGDTSPRDAVSAIKAQWEIRKDILKTGKDLGVVKPDVTDTSNSTFNLSHIQGLTNEEIKDQLIQLASALGKLEQEVGESKTFLETEQKPIYSGASVFEQEDAVAKNKPN